MAKLSKSDEARWARAAEAFEDDARPIHVALRQLNLPKDVFRGGDLQGAGFDKANLRGFDFSDADLRRASFSGALLNGCDFSRVDARGANFANAKMRNVRVAGARFEDANVKTADIIVIGARPKSLKLTTAPLRVRKRAAPKVSRKANTAAAPAPKPVKVTAIPGKAVTASALLQAIADHNGVKKAEAKMFVDGYIDVVKAYVMKGAKVKIGDIGMIMIRHRKARMGRNPHTGEPAKIKASKKLAFRQSAIMRAHVRDR